MILLESNLICACREFIASLATFVGAEEFKCNTIELVIDDGKISNKAKIEETNGRYFFRDPVHYRTYYIPHAESAGVYIFFGKNGRALYVGKSEVAGGIGKRVGSHIGKFEGTNLPNLAFPEAYYVIVIPFKNEPWLAPAFETFLLSRYKFRYNLSLAKRETLEPDVA